MMIAHMVTAIQIQSGTLGSFGGRGIFGVMGLSGYGTGSPGLKFGAGLGDGTGIVGDVGPGRGIVGPVGCGCAGSDGGGGISSWAPSGSTALIGSLPT